MFDELNRYKNNGHFFYSKGDNLEEVSADVPNLPGVFYILRLANGKIDLVFIGKSGPNPISIKSKGQGLKKGINSFIENMKTQDFFEEKIKKEKIDALDIYWCVTFDKNTIDLPSYVEGLLLQIHLHIHDELPKWNKEL